MLTQEEIIQKLLKQPEIFMKAMSKKEYAKASFTEYICECVALFCEVPEEVRIALFGSRQGEEEIEGLFPENLVIKANDQMVLHHKTLQEISLKEKKEREKVWEDCQKKFQINT